MSFADHADTDRGLITSVFKQYETDIEAGGGTLAEIADLLAGLAGDLDGSIGAIMSTDGAFSQVRRNLSSFLRTSVLDASIRNIRQLATFLDRNDVGPDSPIASILNIAVREHMVANSLTYESRDVTHGAVAADGGNVGDGTVLLLTTDDSGAAAPITNGLDLEAITAETLTFEVTADALAGGRTAGQELFIVRGELAARDILESPLGSVIAVEAQARGAETADHISNGTFDAALVGSAATKVPSWSIDTPANIVEETTLTFRGDRSLKVTADAIISQTPISIPAAQPIVFSVMLNRNSTGVTGNAKIVLGGAEKTVSLASLAASGWVRLFFIAWPLQFRGGAGNVRVEFSSIAAGQVFLDEAIVAIPIRIGGRWPLPVPGATDYRLGDKFTQATSISATPGTNKDGLHRLHGDGFELPHSGTPTITDPVI